jgi:hypothetical protein
VLAGKYTLTRRRTKKMAAITHETKVLHYAPSRDSFFSGGGGFQVLVRITYLFGIKIRTKELDRETVPHWHYVQKRTQGLSEWKSRLVGREDKEDGK